MRTASIASVAVSGGFHDGDWVESKDQDPDGDIRLLQLADVGDGGFRDRSDRRVNQEAFDRLNCSPVRERDILIARMPDPLGRACLVPRGIGRAITVVDVAVLRCDASRADPRFVMHAINAGPTRSLMASFQDGATRQRIPRKRLGRVRVPLPSLDQQRAIADYLDRETARIDMLIDEQQRLIEMLRERRFALRVHVALHGTRPATEIDSPLPWATRLPAHWRVVPLTSVARLESGHTPSRSREDWWQECHIPWVSLHDVGTMRSAKYLYDSAQRISDAGVANSSARVLPAGTVALSRDASVGRAAIMGVPMATSQHFAAWVCGEALDPEYLWVLFQDAMQPFFDSFQNGSTIRTIGMGDLKAFRIPLPPLDEQRHIVEYTDEHTAQIDRLIAETERFVELSRERRAALITAAVTGQIDVREMA